MASTTIEASVPLGARLAQAASRAQLHRLSAVTIIALAVLATMIVTAIFADDVAPYDPLVGNYSSVRQPPSPLFWLGTDDLGRDVLSRLIHGSRISLVVAFSSVILGDTLGFIWGLASGYIGRRFDLISQRALEIFLAFPGLILATMFVISLGAGLPTVILAIAMTRMPASTPCGLSRMIQP